MKDSITHGDPRTAHSSPSFDEQRLLDLVDGDFSLLRELSDLFFEDAPRWLEAIHEAALADDPEALQAAAHAVKGAVSHFAADRATALASDLESMGRNGDLSHAALPAGELRSELERLESDVLALLAKR